MTRRTVFAALAAMLCLGKPATAQSPSPALTVSRMATPSAVGGKDTREEIRLPAVAVSGAPRTFQVVSIPVPEALLRASDVEVVIVPKGDFSVLGARTRKINARAGQNRVGITVGESMEPAVV